MTKLAKSALRSTLLKRLALQPEKARLTKSLAIARKLRRFPAYKKAKVVMCYAAIPGEVETRLILEWALADGKRVAVPVTVASGKRLIAAEIFHLDRDLNSFGPFRIPEPHKQKIRRVPVKKIDLFLIPGVAFDKEGRRLGRGGGYYDRFLSRVSPRIPQVGLAFRFQIVKKLPSEPHDRIVSKVITD